MLAWISRKRKQRSGDLKQSKQLLARLLNIDGSAGDRSEGDVDTCSTHVRPKQTARGGDADVESGMFGFLEKKSEKRIFYSYLYQFELTREQLGTKVSRLLLREIHRQSSAVAHRFDEPVAVVSRNIVSAAAWVTIYCLLGPTRMIEMAPDYREIADEVELELLVSHVGDEAENSIYRRVFSILSERALCHPEVVALIDACIDSSPDNQAGAGPNSGRYG